MPGPPKKPLELRMLDGSLNVSRHGRPEDIVKFGKPESNIIPDYLGDEGRRIWESHYDLFVRSGVLQKTDLESFGQLCLLHERVKYADDICNEEGWVIENRTGGMSRHPMAIQRDSWVRELIQYKTRFGMFPSNRNDLQVEKPKTGIKVRKRG